MIRTNRHINSVMCFGLKCIKYSASFTQVDYLFFEVNFWEDLSRVLCRTGRLFRLKYRSLLLLLPRLLGCH